MDGQKETINFNFNEFNINNILIYLIYKYFIYLIYKMFWTRDWPIVAHRPNLAHSLPISAESAS